MKKVVILCLCLMSLNVWADEAEIKSLKDRLTTEEYNTVQRKQDILKDAKRMPLKDLREKYSDAEIQYLLRVNESYGTEEVKVPNNLKIEELEDKP